jgi:single-strand DNA-binding protein
MANYNKVILFGRLTRDPEVRSFSNGGKVAKIGFAVSNRKKNSQTGQWEDEPMFIDVEVFNRGDTGKLADLVADRCRKGHQLMIEGKLHLDSWDDKNGGGKRQKHKIVAEVIQLLEARQGDGGSYSGGGGNYGGQRQGGGGYGDNMSGGGGMDSNPYDDSPASGGGMSGGSNNGGGSTGNSNNADDIPF